MQLNLLIQTIKFLKYSQIYHQFRLRHKKPILQEIKSPLRVEIISAIPYITKSKVCNGEALTFLNISRCFKGWDYCTSGNLWAYNLNYMDWLLQENMTFEEGSRWIDKFIDEIHVNKIGLDPYPIALRGINWIKFISINHKDIEQSKLQHWNDCLFSQYRLLMKKLEYHLLGNHLLEDAYSLFIASLYFKDREFYNKSTKILIKELNRQILGDGAHFEQSPMYHCILLDRLLDCYNFSINNPRFQQQSNIDKILYRSASEMLGHLESIIYKDGSIPLVNDSAELIAPIPVDIFDYAKRLQIEWHPIALKECGYRLIRQDKMELLVDIGDITAKYQPGHSHADTFNYELRIDGKPFIVDTGISTYEKNERRQYERSTPAHNTVTFKNFDSSQVWGGFRVGKRAKVRIIHETRSYIEANHNGFGHRHLHTRQFHIKDGKIEIKDSVLMGHNCISYIHLSPDVKILSINNDTISTTLADINIIGATYIETADCEVATQYNILKSATVLKIHFDRNLIYTIST